MTEADVPDIFGYAIFCDDIRFEHEGKVTLVGTYSGSMLIHGSLPAVMPKFGIHVNFRQRTSLYDPKLKLMIFVPGDEEDRPSFEIDMRTPDDARPPGAEMPFIGAVANVVLAPLSIPTEGKIQVRVVRDGVVHKIGSLQVQASPATASEQPSERSPGSGPAT